MKKLLSFVTITYLLFAVTSCKKSSHAPSTESQLIGKWTMKAAIGNYTVNGNNHKDTTWFTSSDYFDFKADSTISIMETNTAYNGKWKIVGSKLFITGTNYMDYPKGFDLPVLTHNDLQLYYTETDASSSLEQKLNLSR